jgi:restriction endonuclease Mrr
MEALVYLGSPRLILPNTPILLPTTHMDIKHLTSDTLRSLLSITSKKEQLIKAVADIENEIAKVIKGTVTTVVETAEAVTPSKPAKRKNRSKKTKATKAAKKPAKSKKRKSGITPEGRARLAANMKARWAARKAAKPAKKGFKLPKAGKSPF